MFAFAIRVWRFLLTIEFDRVDNDERSTKDSDMPLPIGKMVLGFAPDDEFGDEQ